MNMLTKQAEDLWTADYELRVLPGLPFPTRMTVVRLADGSLVLISPVPIDDALAAELDGLGPVGHLMAPSLLHHLHLPMAQRRYPRARLLGPLELAKKEPNLRFEPLDIASSPVLGDTFSAELVGGASKVSETVLLHRPSRHRASCLARGARQRVNRIHHSTVDSPPDARDPVMQARSDVLARWRRTAA